MEKYTLAIGGRIIATSKTVNIKETFCYNQDLIIYSIYINNFILPWYSLPDMDIDLFASDIYRIFGYCMYSLQVDLDTLLTSCGSESIV